jgi:hypothetical protein
VFAKQALYSSLISVRDVELAYCRLMALPALSRDRTTDLGNYRRKASSKKNSMPKEL